MERKNTAGQGVRINQDHTKSASFFQQKKLVCDFKLYFEMLGLPINLYENLGGEKLIPLTAKHSLCDCVCA